MNAALLEPDVDNSMAELVCRLGNIPLKRIRRLPPPGIATEDDVLKALDEPRKSICELIDGVMVEKAMAYRESMLAIWLSAHLAFFVKKHKLGIVSGEQGMMKLWPGRIRIPDIAFVSWARLPGRKVPEARVPLIGPELAIEILSDSNTSDEMELKRDDYFKCGCRLVWEIDPENRTISIYTSVHNCRQLSNGDTLEGGDVLPGFSITLVELFGALDDHG